MSFCPTLPEKSDISTFLRGLGIDWPAVPTSANNDEREDKIQAALENCPYRESEKDRSRMTSGGKKTEVEDEEGALRINLKRVFQEEGLLGYDPSLGTCTGKATGWVQRFVV